MKRIFLALTVVAALLGGVGTVAAQDATNATNATTATSADGVVAQNVTVALSPTTHVTSWRYEAGTWEISVASKVPTRVTVTDSTAIAEALSEGDGASSSSIAGGRESFNIAPGTTTLRFDGSSMDGMSAVTLTATNGNAIGVLRTDDWSPSRPPVQYGTAQFVTALAAISAAGGTFVYVRRKREEREMEVEREW